MNIAIIGAGFTGLSAAYSLAKKGHAVTLIEQDNNPGGLAVGFTLPHWSWTLENHYHHWFTNDSSVLSLAEEIGHNVITKRPKTSIYIDKQIYQLDSPGNLLRFSKLSIVDRLRMVSVLAFLRIDPYWKPLENYTASSFLSKTMGKKAYDAIWDPQLANKFGAYKDDISLAWFWARIHKRTTSLCYPEGGFLHFAKHIVCDIEQLGGTVLFSTEVMEIISDKKVHLVLHNMHKDTLRRSFDKLIVTTPGSTFVKMAPILTEQYKNTLTSLHGLGAVNLILRLKKSFLSDDTYWLSMCTKNSPILAIVEHTNFMEKTNYDNEHIVYIGNYVPHGHKHFSYTEKQLLETYDGTLRLLNPSYTLNLIGSHIFKAPFAQPIIPVGYSKMVPPFETPLPNVYLANMQQVYPWDRGTNYAVELGNKVATHVL